MQAEAHWVKCPYCNTGQYVNNAVYKGYAGRHCTHCGRFFKLPDPAFFPVRESRNKQERNG